MAVNPNIDGAISDLLERIDRAERIGSVPFSPMDLRAVLAALFALREILHNATGDARKTIDDVMQRAGEKARYATHDAKRGRAADAESSNEHYDPLRDAWWNPQTGKWESSLERNRKRYSGNSAKQPPPGYGTDDIMEKLRRAKEKMERESGAWSGADFAAGAEARERERQRREQAYNRAYEEVRRKAGDYFRQQAPPPPPRDPKRRSWWEVLGVRDTATNQEITKAYRRLAMRHHTDRGGKHEVIVEINVAWEEVRKARGM